MCFILLCLILSRCVCIICLNMIPMCAFLVWFMTRSEKTMATHSSSLAWKIPGAEEPGGLPSMGSQCRTRLKRLSNNSRSSMTCCYCSVAKSCRTPCDPMDCNVPGFSILHCLPEFAQIYVHWADDAIQPAHPPLPPSLLLPSIFPSIRIFSNDSGHFLWVSFSHQVAKVSELQHQFFQWIKRVDFLYWLIWSPCCPRDSQESSATPQCKGINSLVLSLL